MCGRMITGDMTWREIYELDQAFIEALEKHGNIDPPTREIEQRYNVAPTMAHPILGLDFGGVFARWGYIPAWHKGTLKDFKATTFNARSEEAHAKPTFRDAMKSHHCLVPAQGYYEWRQKRPYRVWVETNAPLFFFAGIWSQVNLPDYQGYTFSVLTEPARGEMSALHSRMPVILTEAANQAWLKGGEPIGSLARIDAARVKYHEVGAAVGNVRNEGPDLIRPIAA